MADTNSTDRAAMIRGLRALADYTETHPDVPLPLYDIRVLVSVADRARVEQAADALEVGTQDENGCFQAVRRFGGNVSLQVYCLSPERIARWDAESSYRGSVQPEREAESAA